MNPSDFIGPHRSPRVRGRMDFMGPTGPAFIQGGPGTYEIGSGAYESRVPTGPMKSTPVPSTSTVQKQHRPGLIPGRQNRRTE